MKNLNSILTICLAVIVISSCQKEGPIGPQGSTGATGPAGPQGGAKISDLIFSVSSGTWEGPYSNPTGGLVYLKDISVPFITQEIKENGVVLVYRRINYTSGGYSYTALPYAEVINNNSTRLWSYEVFIGTLRLLIQNTDNNSHGYGGATFRVVAISATGRSANPNVNFNNYDEVKSAFDLKD
jgi:hypothetical protein